MNDTLMKQRYKIVKMATVVCTFWLGLALFSSAQSTIGYFNGPAFQFSPDYASASIDFDQDGTDDFSFSGGAYICTADVPSSACSGSYYVTALGTNSTLCRGTQLVILLAGTDISSVTSSNAVWRKTESATLATYFFSPRNGTSGWGGPLSTAAEGYFGVRFYTQDGLHYGWIHARLPHQGTNGAALEFTPVILDWAYETRPNTPIAAGAVPIAPLAAPRIVRRGNLRLNWQSQVGKAYQVQCKEQPHQPGWINLDFTIIATATKTTVDVPTRNATRVYRAVRTD